MAPQVFDEKKLATLTADTWSFGCLLYEMCTFKAPYGGDEIEAVKNLADPKGKPPGKTEKVTNSKIGQIISKCWTRDPNKRSNMKSILQDLEKLMDIGKHLMLNNKKR